MGSCDLQLLLRMVDECLLVLGTQTIIDGAKARDLLLDIRTLITTTMTGESADVHSS